MSLTNALSFAVIFTIELVQLCRRREIRAQTLRALAGWNTGNAPGAKPGNARAAQCPAEDAAGPHGAAANSPQTRDENLE